MNSLVLNLPAQTTALIGRERQIDEVRRLLQEPDCRLLTLVGPGGIGKTRLAIAVAQGLPADQFEDSVVFVPLQAVTSPDLLPSTIAEPAGITLASHEPLPIQVFQVRPDHREQPPEVLLGPRWIAVELDLGRLVLDELPDLQPSLGLSSHLPEHPRVAGQLDLVHHFMRHA